MDVSSKTKVAATTATVAAAALCTLVVAIMRARYHVELEPAVQDALEDLLVIVLGAVGTGAATLWAAWAKRENHPAPSAVQTMRRRKLT